jgi:RHS repeat-associated protein
MPGETQIVPVTSTESYYRARYYDPTVGRFLSEDPATTIATFNRYPYVSNRPAGFADPLGLFSLNLTETKTPVIAPWWDFTNWGFGRTDFYEHMDVRCVSVGCGGWQRRITLSAKFAVFYSSSSSLHHEQEHVDIAERILKNSAPQFEALERVTYRTKADCIAAIPQAYQLVNQINQSVSNAEMGPEPPWLRWLMKIF